MESYMPLFIILLFIVSIASLSGFILIYRVDSNLRRSRGYDGGKTIDQTLDNIIQDLKSLTDNVHRLKKVNDNHSKLIIKIFQILKDSIESDLTQDQVLELIKGLNLPLDKLKVTVKETQNDQA